MRSCIRSTYLIGRGICLRISWTHGRLDVNGVISTSLNAEQLAPFDMFASKLFRR